MLRFDYGGCGQSGGEFEAQSLADWRDDVLAMIDRSPAGPVVLVGSSMGGWLMLLAALARPERVAGLVGIAAAPDFTAWGFSDAQKLTLLREGRLEEPNPYGDKPHVTTADLLGKRRGASPDARADRASPARSGCSTARPIRTSISPGRWRSPGWSIQPTCRRSSSRTATTGCRAIRISRCWSPPCPRLMESL